MNDLTVEEMITRLDCGIRPRPRLCGCRACLLFTVAEACAENADLREQVANIKLELDRLKMEILQFQTAPQRLE